MNEQAELFRLVPRVKTRDGQSFESINDARIHELQTVFSKCDGLSGAGFAGFVVGHWAEINVIMTSEPGQTKPKARKRRKDFGTTRATNEKPSSDLIDQCSEAVVAEQKASVSFIQRRFFLGYQKALTIMAELERRGVVGPAKGSQPRAILQAGTPVSAPPSCDSLAKPHWENCVLVAASSKYAGK